MFFLYNITVSYIAYVLTNDNTVLDFSFFSVNVIEIVHNLIKCWFILDYNVCESNCENIYKQKRHWT